MKTEDQIAAIAVRLWPDNPDLQIRWRAAVAMVRTTKVGWILDRPITGASHA